MNMQLTKGTLKHEVARDSYWTRFVLTSEQKKQTFVYVCVSHEYLGTKLKTNDLNNNLVKGWVDSVAKEWQLKGSAVFKKPFHLEVRAVTEDGYANGIDFLKKKIVPISSS